MYIYIYIYYIYVYILGNTSAIELSKYVKISPLSFQGKIRLIFALFVLFLAGNRVRSQVKSSESKFNVSYFTHTIPGQLPVKKICCNFAAIGHKGHIEKF